MIPDSHAFSTSEMASVLWAFAKAKRADDTIFSTVLKELMRATESELQRGGQGPKPQGKGALAGCFCGG